jgi:hypothetical protein
MRITVLLVGIAANTFMLRVLVALVMELSKSAPPRVQSAWFRYRPSHSRGELVVIRGDVLKKKFSAAGRIIAGAFVVVALVVPSRGQLVIDDTKQTAEVQAGPKNQRIPQEVIQELETMKKRIEELEAQLRNQGRRVGTDSAYESNAVPPSERSAGASSTNTSLSSQESLSNAAHIPAENAEDR